MSRSLVVAGIVFASGVFGGSRVCAQGPAPAGLRPVAEAPVRSIKSRRNDMAMPASRSGMSAGERGALIGALVGFAAGIAFALAHKGDEAGTFGGALTVGFILAIPGAVFGGLIGHAAR